MTEPDRPGAAARSDPAAAHAPPAPPTVLGLALAFNKLAFQSVGGGLAAWSQRLIVDEKHWLTEEEFLATSAICGILPGANQLNMAVFVGARFRGAAGALAAAAGLVAVPALAAMALGALYLHFGHVPQVRRFMSGMSCAAAALAVSVAWRQGRQTLTSWPALALGVATFAAVGLLRLPLWQALAVLGPLGFWWGWRWMSPS